MSLSLSLSLSHGGMDRKCLCFIGGLGAVGMLATAGLKASDGAEVDHGREWSPYVTVRGGWLFGKGKYSEDMSNLKWEFREKFRNNFCGSGEFGVSCCDDRVFIGLELGYFPGDIKQDRKVIVLGLLDVPMNYKLETDNIFGACNVTLRHDLNDRVFLYGGVGAGITRSRCRFKWLGALPGIGVKELGDSKTKWKFLGQAFAGFGVYLNDDWQLTAGYRLRYLPGDFRFNAGLTLVGVGDLVWDASMKQNVVHAAEVGLTYRF